MNTEFKIEHNLETNEIIEIPLTSDEIAEMLKLQKEVEARKSAEKAQIAKRTALLEKLGITEDEAKLLLG